MAQEFFTKEQQSEIVEAIKAAEKNTSGEVQVHIEKKCKGDAMKRALEVFKALKMHKTAEKNGVLFYLAFQDHKFAILGDEGIDKVVPAHFWDEIKNQMQMLFKEGKFTEGLCKGIGMAGHELKVHFPYLDTDKNELSDEISFGS